MADGDGTSSGVGMGMIIGLLLVVILLIGGGYYFFAGGHSGGASSSPANAVAGAAEGAGHTVSGTVNVK
jgi:hypothetical protein